MSAVSANQSQRRSLTWVIASTWLAYAQFRQAWRILLFLGLITVVVNVFICAIPLFSAVAFQASLQSTFNPVSHPLSRVIRVGADGTVLSPDEIASAESDIGTIMHQDFDTLAPSQPTLTVKTWTYDLYLPTTNAARVKGPVQMRIVSAPVDVMRSHLNLEGGQLPQQQPGMPIQLVLPATTASAWHVAVGSRVLIRIPLSRQPSTGQSAALPAAIVGIAAPHYDDPIFGHAFPQLSSSTGSNQPYAVFGDLAAVLALGEHERSNSPSTGDLFSYYWTYMIDADRLHLDQINSIVTHGNALVSQLQTTNLNAHQLATEYLDDGDFLTTLGTLQTHFTLLQAPIITLMIELIAFVLFFISVMGEFTVAWQLDAIATLRSRGMARSHMLGVLVLQSLTVGLIALPLGPTLAAILVEVTSNRVFPHASDALVFGTVAGMAWSVTAYAAIGVGMIALAMLVSSARAIQQNVVTARQEVARETQRPYWRRYFLDVALVLLGGAGFLSYRDVDQSLGSYVLHTNQYLLAFSILSPLLLVVGLGLLFIRFLPTILHACSYLAHLYRGAVPTVGIAKVARAPRQATNMTLLLGIAVGISWLTTVALATQRQQANDIATLVVGTDFQGLVADPSPKSVWSVAQQYEALPGVTSVSVGTAFDVPYTVGDTDVTIRVLAMDANTFGTTAYWNATRSRIPPETMMRQLIARRGDALSADAVPAIVDASTWNALGLSLGEPFTLSLPGYTDSAMKFVAVDRVPYLPSIVTTSGPESQGGSIEGGIFVDYYTLKAVYTHDVPDNLLSPDTLWIRTVSNQATLTGVRSRLSNGPDRLNELQDRFAMMTSYQHDPVQTALLFAQVALTISVITLALIGALYGVWLAVTQRQLEFAFLRAVGASIGQLQAVMLWEQIPYMIVGLFLGVISGAILMQLIVPTLAFTQFISDSGESSFLAFDTPPVRVIMPGGALAVVVGALLVLWLGGAACMAGHMARKSVSEALRLSQD